MAKIYLQRLTVAAAAAVVGAFVLVLGCDGNPTAPGEKRPPLGFGASFEDTYVKLTWEPSLPNKETAYQIFRYGKDKSGCDYVGTVSKDERTTYVYTDYEFRADAYNYYRVRTMYGDNAGKFSDEERVCTNKFWLWNAGRFTGKVYKINPVTGSVKMSFPTPFRAQGTDREPSGLTWDGKYLWHAEMISDRLYNTTVKGNFRYFLEAPNNQPSGLAWDGTYLWNADFENDEIYRIDTVAEKVLDSIPSPGPRPFGLTWDGTYLWNADSTLGLIYKIDSTNGSIVASFRSPDIAPTGLAWDGTYLWNADKRKDEIYKIDPKDGSVLASFPSPDMWPQGLAVEHRFGGAVP